MLALHSWTLRKTLITTLTFALLGVAAGLSVAAATGAFSDARNSEPLDETTGPRPPAFNRWIRNGGQFVVPEYDDRELGAEQKAAEPWFNPRWKPFAACLDGKGYQSRADKAKPFSQADMDALLNRVNAERPDRAANMRVNQGDKLPGLAGAFLDCAEQWLTIKYEDFEKYGLKDLAPGETPTP